VKAKISNRTSDFLRLRLPLPEAISELLGHRFRGVKDTGLLSFPLNATVTQASLPESHPYLAMASKSTDGSPSISRGKPTQPFDKLSKKRLPKLPSPPKFQPPPKLKEFFGQVAQRLEKWPWLLPALASGVTGVTACVWIFSLPPDPNCKNLAVTAADSERLYCADQAARQGNLGELLKALKMTSSWPESHPLHIQADKLSKQWASTVLVIARQKMEQGNVKQAIDLARQIPKTTDVSYKEAQELIVQWEANADQGKGLYKQAEDAIAQQDWAAAGSYAKALSQLSSRGWQAQSQNLIEKIATEKQAWNRFLDAQYFAESKIADDLLQALELAGQMDPKTLAYKKAQKEVEKWSLEVLAIAQEREQAGDIDGAIALVSKIAPGSSGAANTQALKQLGKAQTTARKGTMWSYLEAWAVATQIPSSTLIHSHAQKRLTDWEQQVRNLQQLQLAKVFASSKQLFGYQLALNQLGGLDSKQPRYAEAQALAKDWKQNVEQIADQPLLNVATTLAQQKQLSKAIEVARMIPPQRPLHSQAQQQINQWMGDIQAVIDRPILDQAIALATEGRLTEAISTAAQIGYERILYPEAQDRINSWIREREAIEAARNPRPATPSAEDDSKPEPEASPEPDAPAASAQDIAPPPEPSAPAAPPPPELPPPIEQVAPPPEPPPVEEVLPPPEPSPAPIFDPPR
jgi:hypothetical protein